MKQLTGFRVGTALLLSCLISSLSMVCLGEEAKALPQIKLLHEFAGGAKDGASPDGSLIVSGSTLFGMTYRGGSKDLGTIFKIQTDGTGYTLLHEFAGGDADGAYPKGSLILSGSTLYGMTEYGGDSRMGKGTVFKMRTDGTGFAVLHSFTNWEYDDGFPCADLVLLGSFLYGMTPGSWDLGMIFRVKTDGSEFTCLKQFYNGENGVSPTGSLIVSKSTLFGMGNCAGDEDIPGFGSIFKMQTDGSEYDVLHDFDLSDNDGGYPSGSLLLSGSWLYGMTPWGGIDKSSKATGSGARSDIEQGSWIVKGLGTIFRIRTDGTGFSLLHRFAGYPKDGFSPYGDLVLSGSTLYSMTSYGGKNNLGTIFKVQIDGSGYAILHEFSGAPGGGAHPRGDLVISGTNLYGMTQEGGPMTRE